MDKSDSPDCGRSKALMAASSATQPGKERDRATFPAPGKQRIRSKHEGAKGQVGHCSPSASWVMRILSNLEVAQSQMMTPLLYQAMSG